MIKIIITANTSWYLYNFRKNTILSLINNGYKVTAVAPIDKYSSMLEELGCDYCDLVIDQGGTNPIKDIKTALDFFKLYNCIKPSVVLNFTPKNNIYSTLAAKLSGSKVINNIAGLGTLFINESVISKIARVLYKYSQSKADFIFFQNEDDRELFKLHKIAASVKNDRLPGSGADLSRFTLSPSPDDNVTRFLLIARMLYDKGIGQYVDAARTLKERYGNTVEFRLLGFLDVDNPSAVSKVQMNNWMQEGVINYLGVSDNVETEISQVDCMVLPSYYREGVPKSLLEACAMGKPIVTTDNVGCRETVDDGKNGYLCEARSVPSLIDALDRMINLTHEQRLVMGKNSREKVEREFDEKIVIDKYLLIINMLLNES
jgi:glycosyltransferase involved in cell wall biosynthesis